MTTAPAQPPQLPAIGALRGFAQGVGLLLRGFRLWGTSPRLMLLGLIPGLITVAIFGTIVVLIAVNLGGIVTGLTPFAEQWDAGWALTLRIALSLALLGGAGVALAYTFTAVTVAIGQPFFEKISRAVDDSLGDSLGGLAESEPTPFWPALRRGLGEGIRLFLLTLVIGLGLVTLGLIPIVGTVAATIIGALCGGWFLALELSAVPFERRGLVLADRRRMLGAQRPVTLGFGVALFVLFLIPLGAVVAMPAAVAGATLLSRRSLGEATAPSAR